MSLKPLYACLNAHIILMFWQDKSSKQASSDLVWDALQDVEPAADTESTGVVIITDPEVLLGSLVMSVAFFSLKGF